MIYGTIEKINLKFGPFKSSELRYLSKELDQI